MKMKMKTFWTISTCLLLTACTTTLQTIASKGDPASLGDDTVTPQNTADITVPAKN